MSKRIDPIRHWSIIVFILIAVGVGVVLLPIIARLFGFSLDAKTSRDLRCTAVALAVLFVFQFFIWIELFDFIQGWREKRAKKTKNPYDQP